MASKSNQTDTSSATTTNSMTDRRVVQDRGNQILDSLIYSADDKVVSAAVGGAASILANISNNQSANVSDMLKAVEQIMGLANKNQLQISSFGFDALKLAQRDLQAMRDSGELTINFARETVGQAMTMAQSVARDQAQAQSEALQIIAETKTGDFADTLKTLSGMMMGFTLLAIMILKGKK